MSRHWRHLGKDDRAPGDHFHESRNRKKRSNELTIDELRAEREELFVKQFGYSNRENPFGDTDLSEPFVWRKKLEKGTTGDIRADEYLQKTKDKLSEIDEVKKRRREREVEERLHEEYKASKAREKDVESYEQWKRIEDEFFKNITQMRTIIRIRERREDVFDVLLKILEMSRLVQFTDMTLPDQPPDDYLMQQTKEKLLETQEHIKVRLRIEHKELLRLGTTGEDATEDVQAKQMDLATGIRYWEALETIIHFILSDRERGRTRDTFKENQAKKRMLMKTLAELDELERIVTEKLEHPDETQDVNFNEMLKARFPYFRAIAVVREHYSKAKAESRKHVDSQPEVDGGSDEVILPRTYSDEEDGYYSPRRQAEGEPDAKWADVEHMKVVEFDDNDEITEWHFAEDDTLNDMPKLPGSDEDADLFFERFVQREKELKQEDELVLEGEEVEIQQTSDTGSIFNLRKPRYFNRVKTGFEWNRYNQTHYDQETPPPKVVQGYKFTISYPNLVDPKQTPTWKILPSKNPNDGTVILRFSGGPPYEDLAFRIVNREWDCNPKRGFKNRFDHSILQLHFNFKRLRYRK